MIHQVDRQIDYFYTCIELVLDLYYNFNIIQFYTKHPKKKYNFNVTFATTLHITNCSTVLKYSRGSFQQSRFFLATNNRRSIIARNIQAFHTSQLAQKLQYFTVTKIKLVIHHRV